MHSKTGSLKLVQEINRSVVLNLIKNRDNLLLGDMLLSSSIVAYATIKKSNCNETKE